MNNPETLLLDLDQIEVPANRLRDADPDRVAEIVISMREQGQLQDIEVLPPNPETGLYPLNIGLHRFMAASQAGLRQLSAKVFIGTALQARLREIDENLYRHELNPLDQAAFLAERRSIYEEMHGLVKRGQPKKRIGTNLSQRSFFDDTTEAFGFSRKTISRALTRFSKLTPEVRKALRGTKTARIASEIDALMKLAPEEQFRVAMLLSAAVPQRSVAAAVAVVRGIDRRSLHIMKTKTDRMAAIWTKATPAERKAFLDWLGREGFLPASRAAAKGAR
jgi:ParB family chromosome partitioning protein